MTSIGKPFKSLESYNKAMTNSLDDKLFFVDKLPKDDYLFVDFGCADGALLEKLQQLACASYIGYDISDEMLSLARVRTPNIEYTNNWLNIEKATLIAKENKKKVVLIFTVKVGSFSGLFLSFLFSKLSNIDGPSQCQVNID